MDLFRRFPVLAVFTLILFCVVGGLSDSLFAGTDEKTDERNEEEKNIHAEREKLKQELLQGLYQAQAIDPDLVAHIPEFISLLDHVDYKTRQQATEDVMACGDKALPAIQETLQQDVSEEAKWRLQRLQYRIRWRLHRSLLNRISDLFDDFESLPPLKRRRVLYQLELSGGEQAVDTMIAVFENDTHPKVRQAALDATVRLKIAPNFERIQNLFTSGLQDLRSENYEQAETAFLEVLTLDGNNAAAAYNMACIFALQNEVIDAVAWLQKAVSIGFQNLAHIMEDEDLETIRGRGEFDDFMQEAFGDDYRARYEAMKKNAAPDED